MMSLIINELPFGLDAMIGPMEIIADFQRFPNNQMASRIGVMGVQSDLLEFMGDLKSSLGRTRTCDTQFRKLVFYPTELRGPVSKCESRIGEQRKARSNFWNVAKMTASAHARHDLTCP